MFQVQHTLTIYMLHSLVDTYQALQPFDSFSESFALSTLEKKIESLALI